MPASVALFAGVAFVIWLLRHEAAVRGKLPSSLWVPFVWLLIQGSRPVTAWFGIGGTQLEGNPIEAAIAFTLDCAAVVILVRRGFRFSTIPRLNLVLTALLAYLLLSCLWAPYSFVAFKRWVKEFGMVFMVLVVLTQDDPANALKLLGVRCAQILFPISVILYKYVPSFGREYSRTGGEMIRGVTAQKNALGTICAVFGLLIIWDLLDSVAQRGAEKRWPIAWPKLLTLGIGMWLLFASHSKTSLVAFSAGAAIFLSTYIPPVNRAPRFFARVYLFTVAIALTTAAFWTANISPLLAAMGRDATFTDRTHIWQVVLNVHTDPLIGCGFYSFWLSHSVALAPEFGGLYMTTAHCGFLESYLDGGAIGCVLLILFVILTSLRLSKDFSHASPFARAAFAFTMMCAIMNFSECYYLRLGIAWFACELAALTPRSLFGARYANEKPMGLLPSQ
jgi:hypothetical protein